MRVLIGCEESQEVCKAFRARGHEAYSCDIQECTGGHPEWHLRMDVFEALNLLLWDLIILHPPCTYMAVSGNRWYGKNSENFKKRLAAMIWTARLWDAATTVCKRVALENPVGVLILPVKPQYIQPWQFGHGETKKTGLWLHNLPELVPTDIVSGREQRIWKMCPSKTRGKERSKTFPGIAKAMAEQWG